MVDNSKPIHVVCVQDTHYLDDSKQHMLSEYQKPVVKNRKLTTNKTKDGGLCFMLKKDCCSMRKNITSTSDIGVCVVSLINKRGKDLEIILCLCTEL